MKKIILLVISLLILYSTGISGDLQNSLKIKQVSDIEVTVEPGVCETTLKTYPEITVNKNNAKLELVSGKGKTGKFPVGTTLETWKATDSFGNESVMSFKVKVVTYNTPPTFNPIESMVISKDSGTVEVLVTGISTGNDCVEQKIKGVLVSSLDKNVASARVEYHSGAETAQIFITPQNAGKTKVTFLVSDNGGVLNGGNDVTASIFNVEVVEAKSKIISEDNQEELKVKMYPNPAKNRVKFDVNNFSEPVNISVFAVSGGTSLNRRFEPGENLELDMGSYNPGIYLVNIQLNNKKIVKKLVLDR